MYPRCLIGLVAQTDPKYKKQDICHTESYFHLIWNGKGKKFIAHCSFMVFSKPFSSDRHLLALNLYQSYFCYIFWENEKKKKKVYIFSSPFIIYGWFCKSGKNLIVSLDITCSKVTSNYNSLPNEEG